MEEAIASLFFSLPSTPGANCTTSSFLEYLKTARNHAHLHLQVSPDSSAQLRSGDF